MGELSSTQIGSTLILRDDKRMFDGVCALRQHIGMRRIRNYRYELSGGGEGKSVSSGAKRE